MRQGAVIQRQHMIGLEPDRLAIVNDRLLEPAEFRFGEPAIEKSRDVPGFQLYRLVVIFDRLL